jgi:hypothetical protein
MAHSSLRRQKQTKIPGISTRGLRRKRLHGLVAEDHGRGELD